MSETPLPGTKAATDAGCRCFRVKGSWTEWDDSLCVLHAPPPEPPKKGFCEHGERAWSCSECADRQASYDAYVQDMRGLTHRRTNDFGADP